jgi:hypothetical protein
MVAFRGLGLEEWSLGEVGLGGASFEVSRVSGPSLGVGSVGNGVLRLVWGVIDISTRSENIKHEDLLIIFFPNDYSTQFSKTLIVIFAKTVFSRSYLMFY